jgi:hypothetical protein
LLNEIPLKYAKVTTNSGPPESILVDFKAWPLRVQWGTNWQWVARFQFTNSDVWDEVSPVAMHLDTRSEIKPVMDMIFFIWVSQLVQVMAVPVAHISGFIKSSTEYMTVCLLKLKQVIACNGCVIPMEWL